MEFSATAALFVIFALMLVLNRIGLPLSLAIVLGGVGMDAASGWDAPRLARDLGMALRQVDLWLLLLVTALLLEYGRFLGQERHARAMMGAARRWGGRHGRAVSLVVIPAAIGLVPMPGGALVSAPLVDRTAEEEDWSPDWKSAVNYWFRHVWEYWWPLYPVVIVTLSIFHLPTWQFMCALIPFTLVSFTSGYFFLVRPHLDKLARSADFESAPTDRLWPIGLSLGMVIAATLLLPGALIRFVPELPPQTAKLLAMVAGMAGGLFVLFAEQRGRGAHPLFAELLKARSLNQVATLGSVMVFQALLNASGLMPRAGEEMVNSGIPLPAIVAMLPFIAGIITGVATGFAGMAFPLVVGLMAGSGGALTTVSVLALAFGFGYAGMMLSPVHLCLILTRNYFAAHMRNIYRHILPCVTSLCAAAILLHLLLRKFGA